MNSIERHERDKRICKQYSEGYNIRQLGEQFGMSFQRVHQILNCYNVPMRPKHITSKMRAYEGLLK